MVSWASKRRLTYIFLIAGFFILVLAYPVFSLFYEAPSCFDGKQNQDERGIDCGGTCELVCPLETIPLITLWTQSLSVRDGVYDAVASIENQNVSAGVADLPYRFKLYDEKGVLIAERRGRTFVNPNERFTVFEGAIETGRRIPVRAFFELVRDPVWVKAGKKQPTLLIQNEVFSPGSQPKLRAEIINRTLDSIENVVITALIFDERGNVSAASKTEVDSLLPQSSKIISFIWPQPILEDPTRIEIVPRVNVIAN